LGSITKEQADQLLNEIKDHYDTVNDALKEGEIFTKLLQHFTQKDLASTLGKARGYVGQRVRIHEKLIDPLKEYLRKDKITYWEAYMYSGLSEGKQKQKAQDIQKLIDEDSEADAEQEESE